MAQRPPRLGRQALGAGAPLPGGVSVSSAVGGSAAACRAVLAGSVPGAPASAAVRARSIIWSMTAGSIVPVTTGTVCASQAAASASLPVR